jgi:hypothetical protein
MAKQKKCPSCNHWNSGEKANCEKCNSLLDKNVILKEEREKIHGKPKIEKPGWLDSYLEKTKDTTNPFVKVVRTCLTVGWVMYMGILSAIIWFAVGFSG